MAKRIQPTPVPLDANYLAYLQLGRELDLRGHLQSEGSAEPHRNNVLADYIAKRYGVELVRIKNKHGSDAYRGDAGSNNKAELKTTYWDHVCWEYGELSVEICQRHLEEEHFWGIFVPGPEGFDMLVKIFAFGVGSRLHDYFRQERRRLLDGGKPKRFRPTFGKVQEFGGVELL